MASNPDLSIILIVHSNRNLSQYLCFGKKKELWSFLILWVFLQLCTLNLSVLFPTFCTSENILFVDIILLHICHFNFLIDWCLFTILCILQLSEKKWEHFMFFLLQCTCFYIGSLLCTLIKLDVFKSLCGIYMQLHAIIGS